MSRIGSFIIALLSIVISGCGPTGAAEPPDDDDGLLLAPLGPDPDSELEEFLHLPTHRGPRPARDAYGLLPLTPATGIILVRVPAAEAIVGSSARERARDGSLRFDRPARRFRMPTVLVSKHEVTRAQYARQHGRDVEEDGLFPATMVSWHDAAAFCRAAGGRLPHEDEWELLARGGDGRTHPWGESESPAGINLLRPGRGRRRVLPVDRLIADAGPFGIHGLGGNVSEWCANTLEKGGRARAVRGGGAASPSWAARCAARHYGDPETRSPLLGFRLLLEMRP